MFARSTQKMSYSEKQRRRRAPRAAFVQVALLRRTDARRSDRKKAGLPVAARGVDWVRLTGLSWRGSRKQKRRLWLCVACAHARDLRLDGFKASKWQTEVIPNL